MAVREWLDVVDVEDVGAGAGGSDPEASDSLKTFGAVHKALRETAGLTQEEYAEVVGYSVHAIAKLEQGRRFPQPKFIERAGEVLESPRVLRAAARNLTRRQGLASWFQQ
jgi:DNA-binding XRE family transcriptional regulator